MNLYTWASRHQIPHAAIVELLVEFGVSTDDHLAPILEESEAAVSVRVRLEATQKGGRLFRNNVGACYDNKGNFLRYGLANESKKMNKSLKSSDLIGIRPVLIGPEHFGQTIGQFVARETKPGGWVYTGTEREKAQLKYIQLIASLGGDASFANCEGTL